MKMSKQQTIDKNKCSDRKCNFPPVIGIYDRATIQPTNQLTDHPTDQPIQPTDLQTENLNMNSSWSNSFKWARQDGKIFWFFFAWDS